MMRNEDEGCAGPFNSGELYLDAVTDSDSKVREW